MVKKNNKPRKFCKTDLNGVEIDKCRELPAHEVIEVFDGATLFMKYDQKEYDVAVKEDVEMAIEFEREDPEKARERAEKEWQPYLVGTFEEFVEERQAKAMELTLKNSHKKLWLFSQVVDGHAELLVLQEAIIAVPVEEEE